MIRNKVRFSKDNNDFISELRALVNDYFKIKNISKYGNASIIVKSLLMSFLYSFPYILMLSGTIHSIPGIFLCWVIMGLGTAGLGMVLMHDANHGSFSQNTKINKWLGKSLYFLGGYPPTWKYQHNTLHHGYTNIDGHDEDIAPVGILRFSPHQPLYKIHKYQYIYAWFFYSLMTLSWVISQDFSRLHRYKKMGVSLSSKKKSGRLLQELIFSKIVYCMLLLIIPLLILPISWYWTLLGFLAMHFISGLILSAIFQTAHVMPDSKYPLPDENGSIENNWAIHQLLTTSDFSPKSKLFSWIIGGLNYQIEHHLFPNISHVHYKSISQIVKITATKYKLPYFVHKSFYMAVKKHIKMLKILGL